MIATSQIKFINICLKRLLYNSNILICDLVKEIHIQYFLIDITKKMNIIFGDYQFYLSKIKKRQTFYLLKLINIFNDFLNL